MTIDPTDYEPRPADELCSAYDYCHQLGCNFSELPHG